MNRQKCLEFLEETKKNYRNQMFKVTNEMGESFVGKNPILMSKEESFTGKWIYKNSTKAKNIAGTIFYEEFESLHSSWCEEFNKISDVYLKNTKKSFIFKNKIDESSKDRIKAYYEDLEKTSKQLVILIDKISNRVHALPKSIFS